MAATTKAESSKAGTEPRRNGSGAGEGEDLVATVATITPAMAARWLEHARYDRQRPVNEDHVRVLATAIRQGHYSAQGIVLVESEGAEFLTNGQHRLTAVVRADLPVREVVIRKRLAGDAAAAEYSRSDIGRPRNVTDQLRAHRLGEGYGLTEDQVKTAFAWVSRITKGFEPIFSAHVQAELGLKSPDDRMRLLLDWLPEVNWYWGLLRDAQPGRLRFLRLQGTGSVALVTRRYAPAAAQSFWDLVAHEEHPDFGTPVAALLSLFNRPLSQRGANVDWWSRMVAACWNAAQEERSISGPWNTRREGSITILGTPYKGKLTESRYYPKALEREYQENLRKERQG